MFSWLTPRTAAAEPEDQTSMEIDCRGASSCPPAAARAINAALASCFLPQHLCCRVTPSIVHTGVPAVQKHHKNGLIVAVVRCRGGERQPI